MTKMTIDELNEEWSSHNYLLNTRWKHHKGTEYVVTGVSMCANQNCVMLTYSENPGFSVSFVRSWTEWNELVQGKPRFEQLFRKELWLSEAEMDSLDSMREDPVT